MHISTGSLAVDELLQGGIETKCLTEIYGEYRCGKTQLCQMMCVTAQCAEKRPGRCGYIDTEGAFRPVRIRAIAKRYSLNEDDVLDNIAYARAHNYEHQNMLLEALCALMANEPFKLIVMVRWVVYIPGLALVVLPPVLCFSFTNVFSNVMPLMRNVAGLHYRLLSHRLFRERRTCRASTETEPAACQT